MKYYTPEMFDIDNIEGFAPELFLQKETLEFQLNIFQTKLDEFKRDNFKELVVFDLKKKNTPTLTPDVQVLRQIKEFETDPSIKEFKQEITRLTRELKNINTQIVNEKTKIDRMFKFDDYDVEMYFNELVAYYEDVITFDQVMETIFNKEFNDKMMYYEIAGMRNYEVLSLLHDKAPRKWKKIMGMILSEARCVYINEEVKLIETFGVIKNGKFDVPKLAFLVKATYQNKIDKMETV